MSALLTLTFLLATFSGQVSAFSVCKNATDNLSVTALDVSPNKPVPGEEMTVGVAFTTPEKLLTSGTFGVQVKMFGIVVKHATFDLCTDTGLTCPLASNSKYTATLKYPLPSQAPHGLKVEAELTFKDQDEKQLTCLDTRIQVAPAESATPEVIVTANLRAAAVLPVAVAVPSAIGAEDLVDFLFEAYLEQFTVSFDDADERSHRRGIFSDNLKTISSHNSAGHSWEMAMNEFGTLTPAEFKARYASGFRQDSTPDAFTGTIMATEGFTQAEAADAVDWVKKGAVTSVKNQGVCGSCWTFSATGALEGAYQISGKTLTDFSQEQILDCDTVGHGCSGGGMDQAFDFLKSAGGICSAKSYPYAEANTREGSPLVDSCENTCKPVTSVTGVVDVPKSSETAMLKAVSSTPVAVAIEADESAFHFYSKGVMDGTCGTKLDHGVLVVGYGTDNGKQYWKIKNSWGTPWGEDGYIRIARGDATINAGAGQCGVLMMASYPTVG